MIAFAAFSFLGTLSLSYYCLTGLDQPPPAVAADQAPVYNATAVPAEAASEDHHRDLPRLRGVRETARKHHAVDNPEQPAADERGNVLPGDSASNGKSLSQTRYTLPEVSSNAASANFATALAAGGASAAEQNATGYAAPDAFAGGVAPVPEPAAWSWIGLGAVALIAIRHAPARKLARGARRR